MSRVQPRRPIASAATEKGKWLNVLGMVDPKEDPRDMAIGRNGATACIIPGNDQSGIYQSIMLPLEISGSYRWQIEFTSDEGGIGPFVAFPVGTSWVRMTLDPAENQTHPCGLERVNGQAIASKDNPTVTSFQIEADKKYLLELVVRVSRQNAEVTATIDGANPD